MIEGAPKTHVYTDKPCSAVRVCGRPYAHRGHHGGWRSGETATVPQGEETVAPHEVPQKPTFIPEERLTPRQRDSLAAYAKFGSQSEAAASIGLNLSTYKNHLSNAYERLGGFGGAVEAFRILGWLRVPSESSGAAIADLQQINALLKNANAAMAELGEDLMRLADAADAR